MIHFCGIYYVMINSFFHLYVHKLLYFHMSHMFPQHTRKSLHYIALFQWESTNFTFRLTWLLSYQRLENICELCLYASRHRAEYLKHIFCCQQHLSHHQHQNLNTLSFAFWNHTMPWWGPDCKALLQALCLFSFLPEASARYLDPFLCGNICS